MKQPNNRESTIKSTKHSFTQTHTLIPDLMREFRNFIARNFYLFFLHSGLLFVIYSIGFVGVVRLLSFMVLLLL